MFNVMLNRITSDPYAKREKLADFTVLGTKPVQSDFYDRVGFSNSNSKTEIIITSNLPSGWYEVAASKHNDKTYNLVFFIEPNELKDILFVESTDTLIAYNESFFTTGLPNNYNRSKSQNKSSSAFFSRYVPIEYKVDKNNFFPLDAEII